MFKFKKLHFGKQKKETVLMTANPQNENSRDEHIDEEEKRISSIRGYDHDTYVRTREIIDYANERTMANPRHIIELLEKNMEQMGNKRYREALIVSITEDINNIEKELGTYSACSVGCSHCCKQAIYLSKYEEDAIRKYLEGFSFVDRKKIREKASVGVLRARDNGVFTEINANNASDEKRNNQEYIKLGIECPFLSEEKTCIIYPVRPITCATFRNYGQRTDCDGQIAPHCYSFNETYEKAICSVMEIEESRKHKGTEVYYLGGGRLLLDVFSKFY